jgi:hypothetical protein
MKVPKRINEALNKKQEFIDLHRDRLEKTVIKLQVDLYDKMLSGIYSELDIKNGKILDTTHNYQILADIDVVYKNFTSVSSKLISYQIASVTGGLILKGKSYFKLILNENLSNRFDKIVEATANKMNARIGLKNGEMVKGGFIESLLKDQTLATQIKNYVSKAVTGQIDSKDFIKGLSDLITGVPKEVLKEGVKTLEKTGALEKQYQRYAYDLYQQYDRVYNNSLADEFGMNYFLYQGGLIEDSRDFCVAHNNKVWTREEAAEWDTWKPYMGTYPEGYEIKQKNIYDIPSYLSIAGYQPLVDFGGPRCRHGIGWIPDELAFELRPELKGSD